LIFVATSDGKVRALDADNGRVLWTGSLPGGSEGIPSMYEVNGRQYLVVPASSSVVAGRRREVTPAATDLTQRGYVVFALPATPD
jgi:quinoprotein glucose dehydrogenase